MQMDADERGWVGMVAFRIYLKTSPSVILNLFQDLPKQSS